MNENIKGITIVQPDGPLKQLLVDYVGNKLKPENNEVNIEMILKTLSEEFPESLILLSQENFINGYKQALFDLENIKLTDHGPGKEQKVQLEQKEE